MRKLLHVLSFTADLEQSKRFYRDGLGLTMGADTPFMVNFSNDGSGLMLLAVPPTQRREVELCFESERVAASVEALRGRGVEFIDELRHLAFGSVIHFRDPEGNLLSLLQPGTGAQESTADRGLRLAARGGGEAVTARTTLALAAEARGGSNAPVLSTAIVNARDLSHAHAYYGHLLGLRVSVNSRAWIQFDTGDIRLALHSRRDRHSAELHHTQPVSFGFTVENLEQWVDRARARRVEFVSAPADEGMGLTAEIVDPEGNIVVVREPVSEASLEERLAEAWEDDEPHRTAMRSPVKQTTHHLSWVAVKPDYKTARRAPRDRASGAEDATAPIVSLPVAGEAAVPKRGSRPRRVTSARTAKVDAARQKPRPLTDAQRARTRPATGRQKKAEAKTLGTAKRAAAEASKRKPIKRAVTQAGTGAPKRTVTKQGTGAPRRTVTKQGTSAARRTVTKQGTSAARRTATKRVTSADRRTVTKRATSAARRTGAKGRGKA